MTDRQINIAFKEYTSVDELPEADKALCLEAVKALDTSHSPYSHFKVGAALQLKSGAVLRASNQENVAYPSGLCAERVALFNWGANHADDAIVTMAVTAQTNDFDLLKPITSCGACLQVMAECEKKQNSPLRVLLYCINGPVWVVEGVQSFLPFLFFEDRLTH
ncbi:cytidine deaminase [Mucilaginibacter sp. UR6-1]|uniref:cytidine deaminase family protein n=1 Tax=Mucilaginibacter sp. UR6-1 TaxID=1435643 RepID=UPI001E458CEB|nr:cytidine deaminase [Mucilaginibacter sp. UR6-1]MCC8409668.1 cytidine deaminase [Mucilaginibacter sp. UR6-1]